MGRHLSANATVSAHDARSVTVSDATVIPVTRALYIGTSGDVSVRMADQTTITFVGVPVGIFPIQVDQVLSTATTASNIIALY
jgi:hypothetical protein